MSVEARTSRWPALLARVRNHSRGRMRQGRRETVTVSSAEADTMPAGQPRRINPRTCELLSSYLRTHLMATLRRATESDAL